MDLRKERFCKCGHLKDMHGGGCLYDSRYGGMSQGEGDCICTKYRYLKITGLDGPVKNKQVK